MKKTLSVFGFIAFFFAGSVSFAQQTIVERQIQEEPPRSLPPEEKIYVDSFYEYSWIKQGGRKINWRTLRNRVAWLHEGLQLPYLEVTRYERSSTVDYTFALGGYKRLDEDSLVRGAIGFGDEVDFIYRLEVIAGYERRLHKTLFWNIDLRYLEYPENDVAIISPGLIWYFGPHYISGSYNISSTESRGIAQWGVFKCNFALHRLLDVWSGLAIGERLYDVFPLDASRQYSYIFFGGLTFHLSENIDLRLGGSYGMEKPAFIDRSANAELSFKF